MYLVVACEELRVFGIFERLSEKIGNFEETVPGLLSQVLQRLEQVCRFEIKTICSKNVKEFGEELVRNAVMLLDCARHGLMEYELLELLEIPTSSWNALFLSMF